MRFSQVLSVTIFAAMMIGCSTPGNGNQKGSSGGSSKLGPLRTDNAAGLSYEVPQSWTSRAPASSMRAAQYSLPPVKEGGDAPELAVFFFGAGQGGDVQANIERWIGQMQQSNGKTSDENAKKETRTVGDFKVTTVRVNGTYAAGSSMMPGSGSAEDKPDYRMWAAVIEGEGGPWFFKATGPQKAMEKADPAFDHLIASLKRGAAPAAGEHTD
jgi:hypothetical protein